MTDDKFKVGDVVILKSGGPLLTVAELTETDGNAVIGCGWFTREGEIRSAEFAPALLKLVTVPESKLH